MVEPAFPKPPKILDRMREALRVRHYSYRTEQTHLEWARRFILFHDKRHPAEMGADEVGAFLAHNVFDAIAGNVGGQVLRYHICPPSAFHALSLSGTLPGRYMMPVRRR